MGFICIPPRKSRGDLILRLQIRCTLCEKVPISFCQLENWHQNTTGDKYKFGDFFLNSRPSDTVSVAVMNGPIAQRVNSMVHKVATPPQYGRMREVHLIK